MSYVSIIHKRWWRDSDVMRMIVCIIYTQPCSCYLTCCWDFIVVLCTIWFSSIATTWFAVETRICEFVKTYNLHHSRHESTVCMCEYSGLKHVRNLKLLQTWLMPSIACVRQCGVSSGRHISASSSTSVSQLKFSIAFILQMRQCTVERSFRAVTITLSI